MEEREGLPVLQPGTAADWRRWLEDHPEATGAWLVLAKKGTGVASPTYAEALDEALCCGWVDGRKMARDAQTYVLRFTPRRPRSAWSQVNRDKALRLAEQGRMTPAGLAAIEAARATGQWERAYAPQSAMEAPDDLLAALAAAPAAAEAFAALDSHNRFAVLYRLQDAKRPATRARRIEAYVAMLARGERLYP